MLLFIDHVRLIILTTDSIPDLYRWPMIFPFFLLGEHSGNKYMREMRNVTFTNITALSLLGES